jgi:hypothetical protein
MNPNTSPQTASSSPSITPTTTPSFNPPTTCRQNEIHLILQGKGGTGKSLIALLLADYLSEQCFTIRCIDADPVNRTLSGYKALDPIGMGLRSDGTPDCEALTATLAEPQISCLVDTGSTIFLPLMSYFVQSRALETLQAAGKTVFVHIPIAGDMLAETLNGFRQIMKYLPAGTQAIVWLNEYQAQVLPNGKPFTDLNIYAEVKDRVRGIVSLPNHSEIFLLTIQDLRKEQMTFNQALAGSPRPSTGEPFNILVQQRLKIIQKDIFEQFGTANL